MITSVIFDMDGLMFDTEALNLRGWRAAGEKYGYEITPEVMLPCVGTDVPTTRRLMMERLGPDFDFYTVREDRIAWSFAWIEEHGVPERPGLRELLSWLDGTGIKRAIATASQRRLVDFYMAHLSVPLRFDAIVSWHEGLRGKPHPDLFLAAAEALGAAPGECVVLEDSHNGIRAAHAAGMIPIMVPDLMPPTPEILALAWRVAGSLSDVIPLIQELTKEAAQG
ncbi:MAG: HAD family phosphatase [Synergistaceae bacterium]|nr:HAD family phosphatase [Synergistaceae bacterium]